MVNSYGPQTRALGLGQDVSPSKPRVKQERSTDGIDERLGNIETHLKMKGKLLQITIKISAGMHTTYFIQTQNNA